MLPGLVMDLLSAPLPTLMALIRPLLPPMLPGLVMEPDGLPRDPWERIWSLRTVAAGPCG